MAQATSLQPGQIRHLLRITAATSRHPERDTLVLLLGLTAGMRVTEIAQIEVQDLLSSGISSLLSDRAVGSPYAAAPLPLFRKAQLFLP